MTKALESVLAAVAIIASAILGSVADAAAPQDPWGGDNHYILECGGHCGGNLVTSTIGPGFTGAWFDPAQSGHGLFIEILPNNGIQAAWFTFNPVGTEQSWFLGVGTYSGNTATVSAVMQPTGGRWIPNFNPGQVVNNAWGALTFTFTDCNHGRVDFTSTLGYGVGSMALTRLTQPAGITC